MTRRQCANPVCKEEGRYFTPKSPDDLVCDVCARKFHDLELADIKQDNGEEGPFHSPDDALTRVQLKISNAQLVRELNEWKRFALSNFSTICSLAAPRLLPRDAQKLAEAQLSICYTDFKEIMAEVEGPVYRRRG